VDTILDFHLDWILPKLYEAGVEQVVEPLRRVDRRPPRHARERPPAKVESASAHFERVGAPE
jgi:hypothetical protein